MKALMKMVLLSGVIVALTGCSSGLTGTWKVASVTPESAQKDFQFAAMTLHKDGTYAACVNDGEETKCVKGEYAYDGATKLLTFKADGGKEREYMASKNLLGNTMTVSSTAEGADWKAELKKAKCCGMCGGKCCCGKCGKECCKKAAGCGPNCTKACCADKKK